MTKRVSTMHHARNAEHGAMSSAPVSRVSFVIHGQCYSMKNSKTLTYRGLKMRTIKNPKAIRFEQDFMLQVPPEYRNLRLGGSLRVNVTVFYPDHRQDLDVALIFDLLQKSGVIENDRSLVEQHLYRKVDSIDPRCEIEIESAGEYSRVFL